MVVFEEAEDAEGLAVVREPSAERRCELTSALCVSCTASWKAVAAKSCSCPAVATRLSYVAVAAVRTCSWALVRAADSIVVAGRVRGHVQDSEGEGMGRFGVTVFAQDGVPQERKLPHARVDDHLPLATNHGRRTTRNWTTGCVSCTQPQLKGLADC
jgi:hypothetical protein